MLLLATKAIFSIYYVTYTCMRFSVQISSVLLNSAEFKVPSSLSADRLAQVAHLLPSLGVTFLQGLAPSQLLAVLPALGAVSFSAAQVEELTPPHL